MRKYYFTITSILVLAIGITSCSNEENKTQNQVAARPSVPVLDQEIHIGSQIWMARNLNVSRYRNGDPIPQVTDPTLWANLATGAWCYYNNDPDNGPIYGKLYNWYAVNDPRGLAPTGYHVPSDSEWTILTEFLGGLNIAGGKMKEPGTAHWASPNTTAANNSGFGGFPGGCRNHPGLFFSIGNNGYFWTSSDYAITLAWIRALYFDNGNVTRNGTSKRLGFSVRCLRD